MIHSKSLLWSMKFLLLTLESMKYTKERDIFYEGFLLKAKFKNNFILVIFSVQHVSRRLTMFKTLSQILIEIIRYKH